MTDITIIDVATVVENSGLTDDQNHADQFIDWLWDNTKYHELQDICADRYVDLSEKFSKFLKTLGIDG